LEKLLKDVAGKYSVGDQLTLVRFFTPPDLVDEFNNPQSEDQGIFIANITYCVAYENIITYN
jgi:hypothetical protein